MWGDPAHIDTGLDSRSATFENPSGARGAGGAACSGRKGAAFKRLLPGERVVLADIEGPGTVRHLWMTFLPGPPEVMRALWMEVYYDGAREPSVSVPCLDFFGLPHGRTAAYASYLTTAQEGRGFNSYVPMPFQDGIRIAVVNGSRVEQDFFYQADFTLGPAERSYLHVAFRRENPTTPGRDFVVVEGLSGPGRFLGCVVGIRVLDEGEWYGEGEVKIYRDGDRALPTICGTGLEDYVGSAWGLGAHAAPFAGVRLDLRPPASELRDFVSLYRWHVPDPIVFADDLRVTIQQIGATFFASEDDLRRFARTHPPCGAGWLTSRLDGAQVYGGTYERSDDYCATAFVYAVTPQPVPRLHLRTALTAIERLPYETPSATECAMREWAPRPLGEPPSPGPAAG